MFRFLLASAACNIMLYEHANVYQHFKTRSSLSLFTLNIWTYLRQMMCENKTVTEKNEVVMDKSEIVKNLKDR